MIWGCLRCSLIYWLKLLHVANILTREVNTDSYERTLIQSKKTQKSKKRKKAKRIKKQNLDFHLGNQLLPQQSDSLSIDTSRLRCFHIGRHFIFTNLLKSFEFISFFWGGGVCLSDDTCHCRAQISFLPLFVLCLPLTNFLIQQWSSSLFNLPFLSSATSCLSISNTPESW